MELKANCFAFNRNFRASSVEPVLKFPGTLSVEDGSEANLLLRSNQNNKTPPGVLLFWLPVGAVGFAPTKAVRPTDLQSVVIDYSTTPPSITMSEMSLELLTFVTYESSSRLAARYQEEASPLETAAKRRSIHPFSFARAKCKFLFTFCPSLAKINSYIKTLLNYIDLGQKSNRDKI